MSKEFTPAFEHININNAIIGANDYEPDFSDGVVIYTRNDYCNALNDLSYDALKIWSYQVAFFPYKTCPIFKNKVCRHLGVNPEHFEDCIQELIDKKYINNITLDNGDTCYVFTTPDNNPV